MALLPFYDLPAGPVCRRAGSEVELCRRSVVGEGQQQHAACWTNMGMLCWLTDAVPWPGTHIHKMGLIIGDALAGALIHLLSHVTACSLRPHALVVVPAIQASLGLMQPAT